MIAYDALPSNEWVEVDVPLSSPSDTPWQTGWSGAVFDTAKNQLVMFERYIDTSNAGFFYSNALWGFDGTTETWTLRYQSPWQNTGYCTIANAATMYDAPWDRHPYNQLAFDPATHQLYLYGGPSYRCFGTDDTQNVWTFDTTSDAWSHVAAAAIPTPYNFYEGTFAFDASRQRIVSSVIESDTLWQYDIASTRWSPLAAPPSLAAQQDQLALVYASAAKVLLTFGGRTYGQAPTADTYELDAATDTWQLLPLAVSPPARAGAGFAYSPDHDVALLYGGHADDMHALADTWLFDFRTHTWAEVPSTGPVITEPYMPLAYDSLHRVFVLPAVAPGGYTYAQLWLFKPDPSLVPAMPGGATHTGGCATSSGASAGTAALLVLALLGLRRRWRAAIALAGLCGCGRLGFDPQSAAAGQPGTTAASTVTVTTTTPITVAIGDQDGKLQDTRAVLDRDAFAIEPGWMVTALVPASPTQLRPRVQVVTGVMPGDVLAFGTAPQAASDPLGTMTLDLGAASSLYTVGTACGLASTTQTSIAIAEYTGCVRASDQLVVTVDADSPTAQFAAVPFSFAASSTLGITGYQPMPTVAVELDSIVPGRTAPVLGIETIRAGTNIEPSHFGTGAPVGSGATASFHAQLDVGDYRIFSWSTGRPDLAATFAAQGHQAAAPLSATAFAMAARELPWIGAAGVAADLRHLTIALDGASAYDVATWSFLHDPGWRGAQAIDWQVVAPYGVSSVALPELPVSFADWQPVHGDALYIDVALLDLDVWNDYGDVRRAPAWLQLARSLDAFTSLGAGDVARSSAYSEYDAL